MYASNCAVWQITEDPPITSMKNDLSYHNLSVEDATELALDRPLWMGGYWQQVELRSQIVQAEQ